MGKRYFVYINTHPIEKHIMLHPQHNSPCNEIFKMIRIGSAYATSSAIEKISEDTIKLGETENSYWLLIWATSLEDVLNHSFVKQIAQDLDLDVDSISSHGC